MKLLQIILIVMLSINLWGINNKDTEQCINFMPKLLNTIDKQSGHNGFNYISAVVKTSGNNIFCKSYPKLEKYVFNKIQNIKIYKSLLFEDLEPFAYAFEKDKDNIRIVEAFFTDKDRYYVDYKIDNFTKKELRILLKNDVSNIYISLKKVVRKGQKRQIKLVKKQIKDEINKSIKQNKEKRICIKGYYRNVYIDSFNTKVVTVIRDGQTIEGLSNNSNTIYRVDNNIYNNGGINMVKIRFIRKKFKNTWQGEKEGKAFIPLDAITKCED